MMDWTDVHFRQLARMLSRHTWLYTEMVVDQTVVHQSHNLVRPAPTSLSRLESIASLCEKAHHEAGETKRRAGKPRGSRVVA